jgi:Tfp pilus assembly protein PilF
MSLISARDGATTWSHKYDGQSKDVFAVQDSIAHDVTSELKVTLADGTRARLAHRETSDPDAHRLYLQGLSLWNKRTGAALRQAISYFKGAIKRDSLYARAYAGLALSYALLPDYAGVDAREAGPMAIATAQHALVLDSTLAEAYAAIASSNDRIWRNANADSAYRHAITLDPSFATAHHWYALLLARLGRFDQAIREMERARELEPASLIINTNAGAVRLLAGQTTAAESILRQSLELDPNYPQARFKLGILLLERGLPPQAVVELERTVQLGDSTTQNVAMLALAYVLSHRTGDGRRRLDELTRRPASEHVSGSTVALVYSALGEHDTALEWLRRGVDGFDPFLHFWSQARLFDSLRADPRGKALFERVESMQ